MSVSFNAKQQIKASLPTHSNLYVWNIPRDMDEASLKQLFEGCGEVESVNIMRDKVSQLSKGTVREISAVRGGREGDRESQRKVLREDMAPGHR